MTIAYQTGSSVGAGSTTVTPGTASGMATTDGCVIVAVTKPNTATFTTPTSWQLVGSNNGGAGTTGPSTGPTKVSVFFREKTAAWSTPPAITVGNSPSGTAAASFRFSKTTGVWLHENKNGTYNTTTAGTNLTVNTAAVELRVGDWVCTAICNHDDAPTWSAQSYTASGITFSAVTEFNDAIQTTTGNDVGGAFWGAQVTAGSGTVAVTQQATANAASTGAVVFFRLREIEGFAAGSWSYAGTAVGSAPSAAPAVTQDAYRFYADGTETGSTALAAQNTAPSIDVTSDTNIGLRIRMQETGTGAVPTSDNWRLQVEKNASGTWNNVSTGTNTVLAYDSANLTDSAATTSRLTGGSGTFAAGEITEDGAVDNLGWAISGHTELLYPITLKATDVVDGDTLRFRVRRNLELTGTTIGQTPTINVVKAEGTATGTFAYAGVAVGLLLHQGTATGSRAYAGVAVGYRLPKATTTGTLAYAGAAVGKRTPKATTTGTAAYVGVAVGKRTPKATGSGTRTYVGVATGFAPAKVETLTDTFPTTIDSSKWTNRFGGAVWESGRVKCESTENYEGILSQRRYDMRDSFVSVVVEPPAVPKDSRETILAVRNAQGDGFSIIYTGDPALEPSGMPYLCCVRRYSNADDATYIYGADAQERHWRLRMAGTTGYWETSADGWNWNIRRTATLSGDLSVVEVDLSVGQWQDEGGTSYGYFDNVSVGPPGLGTGAGTRTYAGTAVGKRTPKATGAGTLAYAGAAVGTAPAVAARTGTASGTWSYAGAAVGKRTPKATTTGTLAYAGAAVGKRVAKAITTGTLAYVGAAVGKRVAKATGVGTLAYAGAAVGKRTPKATVTGGWAYAGTAVGKRTPKATTTGTRSYAGTAVGDAPSNRGTATGTFSYAGTAVGRTQHRGSATGTVAYAGSASALTTHRGMATGTLAYAGAAVGKRTPKAVAAGILAYAGTAVGLLLHRGPATGSWSFTGAAVGKRTPKATAVGTRSYAGVALGQFSANTGAATGNRTYVGTATGLNTRRGTATGTFAFTGTAAGLTTHRGTATGTWSSTGTASGLTPRQGSATGARTYSGAAVGKQTPKAVSTGVWAYLGAAVGKRTPKATTSGTFTYAGSASGFAPLPDSGVASGTWRFTGAAVGKRTPKAAGAGSWAFTGTAVAAIAHYGTASGFWSYSGSATGKTPQRGTATGSFTWTGTATGRRVYEGLATGSRSYVGAASGIAPILAYRSGTATGTWGFTGRATNLYRDIIVSATLTQGALSGVLGVGYTGVLTGKTYSGVINEESPGELTGAGYQGRIELT